MIKKLKDIFYDLNDILVALIIIAAASLVIVTNIDSILGYPASIAQEIQLPGEETPTNYAENPPIGEQNGDETDGQGTTGAGIDDQNASGSNGGGQNTTGGGVSGQPGAGGNGGSGNSGGSGSGSGTPVNISISIPSGSTGDKIADILIEAGLVKDRQEFNGAAAAAGAEGRLRAGDFVIPSNATPAEIISILTR